MPVPPAFVVVIQVIPLDSLALVTAELAFLGLIGLWQPVRQFFPGYHLQDTDQTVN